MSRPSCEPKERLPCRRGPRWLGLAALALTLAAVPLAPEPPRAAGFETADYGTAAYGDRARVEWRQEPSGGRKLFDATVLRPFQLGQVMVSAGIFVLAYPVAWTFGVGDEVLEVCITEPMARFSRPLGDL